MEPEGTEVHHHTHAHSDRKRPIRVGVAGLGQGRPHLNAFQARGRYADLEELLTNREVDLVVIATPDHLHGQQVIQALEAGKHVLSEIPMETTTEEIHRIIALTDRTGLKYQMGNQVRYAHCLQDVQHLIANGVLTAR